MYNKIVIARTVFYNSLLSFEQNNTLLLATLTEHDVSNTSEDDNTRNIDNSIPDDNLDYENIPVINKDIHSNFINENNDNTLNDITNNNNNENTMNENNKDVIYKRDYMNSKY